MDDRALKSEMLPTPFVASFFGRAREGDLYDPDGRRRAAAWAHWAVSNMTRMTGFQDRSYVAITLDGRFYDPRGQGPVVRPHLEIPSRVINEPDAEFPDRLALMGNGLSFAWWLPREVTAAKRALFNTPSGSLADVVELLNERRTVLIDAVQQLSRVAMPQFSTIEALLVSSPDGLLEDATGGFEPEEVAEFFPAAAGLQLRVTYDPKLRETQGASASRRLGVWQLSGVNDDADRFGLGVITPRLTRNSLFRDRLFAVEREGAAALLVRGLLLRRLVSRHLNAAAETTVGEPTVPQKGGPRLRTIVSQIGAKMPEASLEAAVHFLQTYPDPDAAWAALTEWAARTQTLLTVTQDGFYDAHKRAQRAVRRAEEPSRETVNLLLPLGWDGQSRVVRVTFSKPPKD